MFFAKVSDKIIDFFNQNRVKQLLELYNKYFKSSKPTYITIYIILIGLIIQQVFADKLSSFAESFIRQYNLEEDSAFWITEIVKFLDKSSIEVLVGAIVLFMIILILDFLDKVIILKVSKHSLKTNKRYLDIKQDVLEKSIKRELEDEVLSSIQSSEQVIVIQGEEGIGKTILARQLVQKLSSDYRVQFFRSDEWQNFEILDEVVYKGHVNDFEKAVIKEPKEIVVFLDGVNEKNALNASIQILESYHNQVEEVKNKITLVFTTRDLSSYSVYIAYDWKHYKKIELKKFTEDELERAIKKLEPSFNYSHFPKNLKSIASIPRYLALALKLKEQLKSFDNITKAMLYFEGLKEQIIQDPKIREIGLTEKEDIENVLYHLAQTITLDNGNKAVVSTGEFHKIFGEEYRKNKTPFKENRIVNSQEINKLELNFDLVVIAYSIYLLTLFDELGETLINVELSLEEIADFFKEKLEPYDNDNISYVPFIVFQLSLEKELSFDKESLSRIYTGLLHLWLDNHNASISSENLDFWAYYDLTSFINILDDLEINRGDNFRRTGLKTGMLEILTDRWKEKKGEDKALKEYLVSSILQDFEEENIREDILYIRRAVKILFAYPLEEFLDVFLKMNEKLLGSNIQDKEYKLDRIYNDVLSILFRFGYKEDIFDKIRNDSKYYEFSQFYNTYSLATSLGLELNTKLYGCGYCLYVEKIETGIKLLQSFDVDQIYQVNGINSIACRKDLDLSSNDKQVIRGTLVNLPATYQKRVTDGYDRDIRVAESFLPLLASFDVEQLNEINQQLLFESIKQKSSVSDIEKFSLVILNNEELVNYIIDSIDDLLNIEHKSDRDGFVVMLMEVVLFSTTKEKALEFFDLLWEKVCTTCISYDLLEYIEFLIKDELLSLVYKKIERYHSNEINNVELYESYMTYLYYLHDYTNIYLKEWIIDKSATWGSDTKKNDLDLKVFVAVLSPLEYFERIDAKKTESRFISYWVTKEEGIFQEKSVEELIEILPIESVGKLLYKNKRFDDIDIWAVSIFENSDAFRMMNLLNTYEPLEVFVDRKPNEFLKYAIEFLDKIETQGINFVGGIQDIIIELLLLVDLEQAIQYFDIKKRKDLNRHFIKQLFDVKKFPSKEYQDGRKNIILSLKNDLEFLQVISLAFQGSGEDELMYLYQELLSSKYATDRLKAISIIVWFGSDETIAILKSLKLSDDSKYVREYARWAEQVALQEKCTREIYEEVLQETDIEIISAKLYQIKDSLTPTFHSWAAPLHEKYCSGCNKIYIQRFLDKTEQIRKSSDKTEVYGRKLVEYYCGDKISNDFKYITSI